jgi:CsoR family transcriptional regulator, copper-sensing transcriptional repressor
VQRLNRVEGQIPWVEERRQCVDVLMQLASVQEALRGMTKLMMRNYLENCAIKAICSKATDAVYDELMDVVFKIRQVDKKEGR